MKKSVVSGLMKKVQGSLQNAGTWGRDDPEVDGYEMRHDSDWKSVEEEPVMAGGLSSHGAPPPPVNTPQPRPRAVASQVPHPVDSLPPHTAESSHAPRSVRTSSHATSQAVKSSEKSLAPDSGMPSNDPAFNAFAAEFDHSVNLVAEKNEQLQSEIDKLRVDLKQALLDKADMASKYEKLTAICRSQRQEIQDLKFALGSSSSPNVSAAKEQQASVTTATGSPLGPSGSPSLSGQQQRPQSQGGRQIHDQA
jgi:AP2-associated kinase